MRSGKDHLEILGRPFRKPFRFGDTHPAHPNSLRVQQDFEETAAKLRERFRWIAGVVLPHSLRSVLVAATLSMMLFLVSFAALCVRTDPALYRVGHRLLPCRHLMHRCGDCRIYLVFPAFCRPDHCCRSPLPCSVWDSCSSPAVRRPSGLLQAPLATSTGFGISIPLVNHLVSVLS